jgi:hypothetical protein
MREDLADLYLESTRTARAHRYRGRQRFLHRLAGDLRQPGFGLIVAETTALAGYVFGFSVGRDGTWWRGFRGSPPAVVERLTAAGQVFAVTAIVVHPHEHDRGLSGRLQRRVLADHHAALGATLLADIDDDAFGGFAALGWQQIGEIHRPSGPAVLRALVLPLGERTATALQDLNRGKRQRHRA